VLLNGAERLRRSQEASSKKIVPDFHQELLRVRQTWRLKKVGDTILGDLSYKSGKHTPSSHGKFVMCTCIYLYLCVFVFALFIFMSKYI